MIFFYELGYTRGHHHLQGSTITVLAPSCQAEKAKSTTPFENNQPQQGQLFEGNDRPSSSLQQHHSQAPPSFGSMSTAPWHCTCGRKNSHRAEFCQNCGTSWLWVFGQSYSHGKSARQGREWEDGPKTPRQRSQSKSRGGKGKGTSQRGEKQMAANKEARRWATVQPKIRSPGSLDQSCLLWESHPRMQRQPNQQPHRARMGRNWWQA